ncbi:hypothetical protein FOCC_FOCC000695 [Frankliniella occidentalis]|nr:hypothetical protein FOCC_FOCC000695 [Frankliniella occidentalis]
MMEESWVSRHILLLLCYVVHHTVRWPVQTARWPPFASFHGARAHAVFCRGLQSGLPHLHLCRISRLIWTDGRGSERAHVHGRNQSQPSVKGVYRKAKPHQLLLLLLLRCHLKRFKHTVWMSPAGANARRAGASAGADAGARARAGAHAGAGARARAGAGAGAGARARAGAHAGAGARARAGQDHQEAGPVVVCASGQGAAAAAFGAELDSVGRPEKRLKRIKAHIHRRMSVDDLRQLFQVESHDEVPEYEVVRVRSRLPERGDLAGGGGGGTTTTTTTTTTTSTPPPSPAAPADSGGQPGAGAEAEAAAVSRVVELSAFGRQHQLRLRPAHGLLNKELRVFVADHANGTDVDYTELEDEGEHLGEIFQDEDNEAALLLHRDPDGSYLLDGTIGDDLVVKPVPASVRQHLGAPSKHQDPDDEMFLDEEDASQDEAVRGFPLGKDSNGDVRFEDSPGPGRRRLRRSVEHHAHIVYKRAGSEAAEAHPDLSDYAFMEPDALPVRASRSRRSIVKREAPYVIYPEILVIVDYDGYRLHGGDNVQIKRYFVSFWNGVDLRYKLLKGPRIRISIAGIIISRGRDATPYLERNRVGRDAIDSAAALTDMGKYLFRERRLPVYDIAVAVTK